MTYSEIIDKLWGSYDKKPLDLRWNAHGIEDEFDSFIYTFRGSDPLRETKRVHDALQDEKIITGYSALSWEISVVSDEKKSNDQMLAALEDASVDYARNSSFEKFTRYSSLRNQILQKMK